MRHHLKEASSKQLSTESSPEVVTPTAGSASDIATPSNVQRQESEDSMEKVLENEAHKLSTMSEAVSTAQKQPGPKSTSEITV